MTCPRCHAPAEDVRSRGGNASQCTRCRLVFDPSAPPSSKAALVAVGEPEAIVTAPFGVDAVVSRAATPTAYRGGQSAEVDLRITLQWQRTAAYTIGTCLWSTIAFGIAAVALVFLPVGRSNVRVPEIGLVLGVGFLIALYGLLAVVCNRTTIELKGSWLLVRHGPLPWWRNRGLDSSKIEQLFCDMSPEVKGAGPFFHVNALLRDGRSVRLAGSLRDPEQALFVERQVERVLGIVDRAVPGELGIGR